MHGKLWKVYTIEALLWKIDDGIEVEKSYN